MFLSNEAPTLEMLDFTIRIGSTPTFFIFRFLFGQLTCGTFSYLVSDSAIRLLYLNPVLTKCTLIQNIYLLTATLNFANHF